MRFTCGIPFSILFFFIYAKIWNTTKNTSIKITCIDVNIFDNKKSFIHGKECFEKKLLKNFVCILKKCIYLMVIFYGGMRKINIKSRIHYKIPFKITFVGSFSHFFGVSI